MACSSYLLNNVEDIGRGAELIKRRRGVIIGVFSAKGGVGKTTAVVNIGAAMAQKLKNRVVVVETNMTASNLGLYMGILDSPVVIQDVVLGKRKLEDAICTTDFGIHVIPGSPAFVGEIGSIDIREILEQLRKKYDAILLDSAPGFGPEVYASMRACDELVVVCQPQVPAIAGTLQTFRTANHQKLPILGAIMNRVTGKRYEVPISHIKKILNWPLIGVVPEDDMVPESTTRAIPLVIYSQNSPAAVEFRKIAQAILTHIRARRRVAPRRRRKIRRKRLAGSRSK